jgi:hypothetical protein
MIVMRRRIATERMVLKLKARINVAKAHRGIGSFSFPDLKVGALAIFFRPLARSFRAWQEIPNNIPRSFNPFPKAVKENRALVFIMAPH